MVVIIAATDVTHLRKRLGKLTTEPPGSAFSFTPKRGLRRHDTARRSYFNTGWRARIYIYQVQGPQAIKLMSEVTDGKLPQIGFFHIGEFEIKGRPVRGCQRGASRDAQDGKQIGHSLTHLLFEAHTCSVTAGFNRQLPGDKYEIV